MSESTPTSGETSEASAAGHLNGGVVRPASGSSTAGTGPSHVKPRGFVRRHWVLLSLGVVLALIVGSAGGYYYWLQHTLSNTARIDISTFNNNPPPAGGAEEKDRALNILLLGADNGANTQSVADDLKDGKWTPFSHRSDTLMIVHIPADRKSLQLVSIPRDTWVPIQGYPYSNGHGKINAAFAYGGPDLAVSTVQKLTGIQIDHLAVIDWQGFRELTTALDGVRVYIPQTFYDTYQHITWQKGWTTVQGKDALAYVRTRHGLTNGDFDRIARQQNFLRATLSKMLTKTHSIIGVTKIISVVTKYLTIDKGWDNSEIINLALSLRNIKADNVQYFTAPLGRYDTSPDGESIVRLQPKQSRELFTDVKNDDIAQYVRKYPDAELHGNKSVS